MNDSVRFLNTGDVEFFPTLRKRVADYFQSRKISTHANWQMILKTVAMFSWYLVPYFAILFLPIPPWGMLLLAAFMGAGLAGMGMTVMHDANHAAYSHNKYINLLLGYTLNILGGSRSNWKIQHNKLHHTFTNIHGSDNDLNAGSLIRLSPHHKHKKLYRYQHIYAWLIYGMMTLLWITIKDVKDLMAYKKKGFRLNKKNNFSKEVAILVISKALYYCYITVIPLLVLSITWWQYLIGFFVMHFTAGLILSVTFQLAHVVEKATYPSPDSSGNIHNMWAIHQLHTTANFARKNPFLSWYMGGLNFQIEHHLFPKVCHIHYKKISKIVKETVKEFKLPYNEYESALKAVFSHYKMLKSLGHA